MKLNTETLGTARTLYFLNQMEERYGTLSRATEMRRSRQKWLADIKNLAEPLTEPHWSGIAPGTMVVALCTWSRDCDMCESTSRRLVVATPAMVQAFIDHDNKWAEGPMNHWLQRPSDEFEHEFRDRALEAFEDGHPHSIY